MKNINVAYLGYGERGRALLELVLGDGASRAKKIVSDFTPRFNSIKDYLSYIDGIYSSGDRIEYKETEAVVRLK